MQFRALADALPTLAWTARADGYIDWYNARWYAYTGTTPADMEGWGWQRVHDPATLPAVMERWTASIVSGQPFEMTFPLRGTDGVYRDFLTRAAPVRDDAGHVVRWFGTNTDLTPEREAAAERERVSAERARLLAEAEAARAAADLERRRLLTILEQLPVGVVAAEAPSGQIVLSNAATRRIWGTQAHTDRADDYSADYVGYRPGSAVPVASHEWPLARTLATGEVVTGEVVEVARPDGTRRTVSLSAAPVRDGAGQVVGGVVTALDVTERERLLAESEAGRAALAAANAELATANAQLQEQGLELELSNQQLQEQAAELEAQTEELQATAAHLEEQVEATDRAAAALRASDARYRALLGSVDVGFCVVEVLLEPDGAGGGRGVDYRFLETNAAFVRQGGFDPFGRRMRDIAPDIEAFWPETYGRVAVTGTPARLRHASAALGRVFDVFAYRVDDPALRRVAVLFTDVTAEVAAARERERLLAASEAARADAEAERARAQEANQAKGAFLANMSHELRTPLNAIGGYTQLLDMGLHGPVTDDQRGALGRVTRAQQHLLGLINDILNYAKLEGGKVEYDVRAVDLREVVRDVTPLIEPQLAAKGLRLDVRLPEDSGPDSRGGDAPCTVWADRDKLGQVLVNLLSNAAKFTDAPVGAASPGAASAGAASPGVTLSLAVRTTGPGPGGPDAGRPDVVFLRVSDTGRGISRDKQDAIFEPFVQVGKRHPGDAPGTGLGLAISRDLARGMGGDLRVRSAPGEGATFTVTLRRVVTADGRGTDRRADDERREAERRADGDRRHDPADHTL